MLLESIILTIYLINRFLQIKNPFLQSNEQTHCLFEHFHGNLKILSKTKLVFSKKKYTPFHHFILINQWPENFYFSNFECERCNLYHQKIRLKVSSGVIDSY
jgi:hypothetical protein